MDKEFKDKFIKLLKALKTGGKNANFDTEIDNVIQIVSNPKANVSNKDEESLRKFAEFIWPLLLINPSVLDPQNKLFIRFMRELEGGPTLQPSQKNSKPASGKS